MDYLKRYENVFDQDFRDIKKREILFLLSLGIRQLLKIIVDKHNDSIAYRLLKLHRNEYFKISFIDRSKEIDNITYIESDKALPIIEEIGLEPGSEKITNIKSLWVENRTPMKIGRFINRYLRDEFSPKDIEIFVNRFKAESKKDVSGITWERVHSTELKRWYSGNSYVIGGGTLNKSCLRKTDKNEYLNFLANNPNSCRLLILKNDQNLLLGRALMWKLTEPNDKFYMDRVYTRFDEDINLFIDTAKHHGWLYKSKQTFGGDVPLIDGKTGELSWIKMKIDNFQKDRRLTFRGYPYMDTFQYYDIKNNILTNDNTVFVGGWNNVIKLNKVDGGYSTYEERHLDDVDMLD